MLAFFRNYWSNRNNNNNKALKLNNREPIEDHMEVEMTGCRNGGAPLLRVLPPEMVEHILKFLPPKDLAQASRTCRGVYSLAQSQSIWRNLAPIPNEIEDRDVQKFGWKALSITLLRKSCFFCGAHPSFVFLFDNTRRCEKCLDVNSEAVTHFVALELAGLAQGNPATALQKFCITIGRMGKLDAADAILEQLLHRQSALHGEVSAPVATVLYHQAQVYRMRSNAIVFVDGNKIIIARKGRDALLRALEIRKQLNDNEETIETADCLGLLGGFLTTAAHWTPEAEKRETLLQAKAHVEHASQIYEKLQDDRGLAQVLKLLGGMYLTDGDEKKAIECIERSLQLAKRAFGDRDVNVADVMQYFGYLYWNLNREDTNYLRRSLEWHQRELEIREEALGKMHPITSRAREDVCIILRKLGREQEARSAVAALAVV